MGPSPQASAFRRFLLGEPFGLRSPLTLESARETLGRATLPSVLRAPHGQRPVGHVGPQHVRLQCLRVPAELLRLRHFQRFEGELREEATATVLRGRLRTSRAGLFAWAVGYGLAFVAVAATTLQLLLGERDAQSLFGFGFTVVVAYVFARVLGALRLQGLALRHHLRRELLTALGAEPLER